MVKRFEPCLSILVLSEDSTPDAHATLEALAKRMLRLVDQHCMTNRIDFEPASRAAATAVRGTSWKTPGHPGRVDLLRTIATKLMEPDGSGFVLFHVDGDRIWKERDSCEHEEKFEQAIRLGVEQVLMDRGVPQADREAALFRLVLVMPFWCIEAWCYQNTLARTYV